MPDRSRDGKYRVEFVDGTELERYGRPVVAEGVLHLIRYIGGGSMSEVEESRISFSLANVKSWEKVSQY